MKRKSLALACAISSVLTAAAFTASAAETPIAEDTVVVTGSYIRGTPEDTALPVDVVTAEDLQQQGSPTMVQLIKTLPATSGGGVGESNRFLGTAAGSATVNLRGFGAARTLVLMNGKRLATVPTATTLPGSVDINLIPTAALGSIEVLKDGAAATYGSDAVAGVVNFITRRDLDGVEANAQYSQIKDSDGDYSGSLAWGKKLDNGNVLVTMGYRRRSELKTKDVEWAIKPFSANTFGGWSGASNPGTYATGPVTGVAPNGALSTAGFTTSFLDDGCSQLGGTQSSATSCLFQFTNFDNLVNDEYHYQVYGELNYNLTDTLKAHGELLWARHEVPDERVSPAQSTVQFPTPIGASTSGAAPGGGTSPYPAFGQDQQSRFYIPATNPGLAAFIARHCPGAAYCANIVNGVITSQTGWRPEGWGGNPLFDDGADHQDRHAQGVRASFGLSGTVSPSFGWDASVTWMRDDFYQETPDIVVNRLELALRGFGGPNCSGTTAGANGCLWFNPFSSAVERSAVNGAANPFYNPATANSNDVLDWMHQYIKSHGQSDMTTADLVFNGELPLSLWAGNIRWAFGGQFRHETQKQTVNDLGNINLAPCVDSADDGSPACSGGIGPYTFYNGIPEYDLSRNVKAVFAEVDVPITDSLSLNAAGRYEQYPGAIGSTTNPKISMKWQVLDWVALRGSWGSTFRAPTILTTAPGASRILAQFTNPQTGSSLYRPVNVLNNPNLEPETADTYNVGVIVKAGGFSASVDYYNFKFRKELTTETAADLFRRMFPNASTNNCADPQLLARFSFAGGVCAPGNFLGITTNQINGPGVDTDGVDFQAQYVWNGAGPGDLTVGFDGNHLMKYERGAVLSVEGFQIAAALDRAGQSELLSAFYSYPKWRGNAFANYAVGEHNVRVDLHYVGGTIDRNHDKDTSALVRLGGIDPYKQIDVTWRWAFPSQTTLTLAVQNVLDKDPSSAFSQYNYDYTVGNPLGRVYMVALKQLF